MKAKLKPEQKAQIGKFLKFRLKVSRETMRSLISKVDIANHQWITKGGHCVDF